MAQENFVFDNPTPVVCLILVAVAVLFFSLRGKSKTTRRRSPRTSRRSEQRPTSSSRAVPGERAALTRHITTYYSDIERVKRMTLNSQGVPGDLDAWLAELGRKVCSVGVHTQDLDVRGKFAAIFVVNKLFHDGRSGAGETKNFLQRTILLYHRKECALKLIRGGKYAGTYEISCGVWTTHLPQAVVEGGALERPGKPSPASVLRGTQPTHRRRMW